MNRPDDELYFMEGFSVPETPAPGEDPAPWKETRVVGKPIPRVDAYERVSGRAVYPSDVILPNMLYGAMLRCPHPNALLKWMDVSKAKKMPGVFGVIPGSASWTNIDWSYRGKGKTKLFDLHCRYEGDAVAAVAADTPYHAWDAIRAIEVGYQVLPFVSDQRKALDPKAPKVHDEGNLVGKPEAYQRGDVNKGFAEADIVLEQEYATTALLHTPLELHGCVAKWDGDQLTIWESTQGVFAIQEEMAKALKLPLSKVRVINPYMGGGFGCKLQPGKHTACAAILARMTGRPVKFFITREETYLCTGNRPANIMTLKAGIKKDGTLTALQFTASGESGAYPAGGVQLLDFQIRELYSCPNVKCECTDLYVNAGPARPFRAPGHPQASWALEQMLDALAEKAMLDPVDLRIKNIPTHSQSAAGNPPYTSTGFKKCLEEGAEAFGWTERRAAGKTEKKGRIRTGVGVAGATWFMGGGRPPSTVVVRLFADGSANLNMGASDLGTGTRTIMAMIVGEELGIKPNKIQIESADTGTTQFTPPSGGSKTVPSDGPATRAAAVHVKQQLLEMAGRDLKVKPEELTIVSGKVQGKNDPSKSVKISDISELKTRGVIIGVGYKKPNPPDRAIHPFGAQFCEVKVDTLTGEVEITRFVSANDSGRVMNRLTYDNQVRGGVIMGIGLGLIEGRVLDPGATGKLCNKNWYDYKLPTALDVPPEIISVPVDPHDTEANSIGAKGLGEPVT
ncbi:MAG: xanthine dehydrogenase family protein molybdopterin-binding subunit, partial [Pseudomonadota bacterium]